MIIPLEVDVPYDRTPVVNWLVIAGIILVFGIQILAAVEEKPKSIWK